MADGEVIIEMGVDDSGIKEKLEETKENFEELGKETEKIQKETEKTTSKYKELTDAIEKQQKELSDLKGEYTAAIINFGQGSAEAKELKAKMSNLNSELEKNQERLGKAKDKAAELSSALDENEKSFNAADVAIGDFVSDGLQNLIGSLTETVAGLIALSEETREFREDMAKLDSAFTSSGHSVETAHKTYDNFYKILGESDRTVEAVNHLAEFTKNEEELAQWSTICAGVTAKFGDSLPIEGLTEAANETAKVGAVTGPLADALNWAGVSEDNFNKKLEKCRTEQERASLITKTLNGLYEEGAAKYNELTASTQKAREATNKMEQAQAGVGATLEPLTTAWTNLKANALEAITPVIQSVVTGLQNLGKWMQENPEKAKILKGVLLGIAAALGVIAIALGISGLITLVTNAFAMLGSVLAIAFSPVTLIIAAIAGLVAAFIYLWNNCEAFRNFFIGIWEAIKPPIMEFISYLQGLFQQAWEYIKGVWDTVQPYFSAIWEAIKAVFSTAVEGISLYFKLGWEVIKVVWSVAVDYFKMIWFNIKQVFSVVKVYFEGLFRTAWEAIKAVWNAVTGYFKAIWETIKGIFSVVKAVLSGNWKEAWEGIKKIVGVWKDYFAGVWNSIKNVFASVKTWFSSTFSAAWTAIKNIFSNAIETFKKIGSNIVDGMKNGIKEAWGNLKQWFSGLFGDLIGIAKKILGIKSPSRVFRDEIGKMIVAGIEVGIEENKDKPVKALGGVFDEMQKFLDKRAKEQIKTVADYNAEYRQENIEHTNELKKLEKDKNKDLTKLEEKFNEDKLNLDEKLIEAKKAKNADKVKLDKEYEKNVLKLKKDYAEDVAAVNEKYNTSVENQNKKHADNIAKIEEQIQNTVESKMKQIVDLQKNYKDNLSKLWEDLDKEITSLQDNYNNTLESRAESIANSLNIFKEATKNSVSGNELKKNLKSQVDVLEDYNEAITKLEERNVNSDFVNYLKGLGVGSAGEIEALSKMNDKSLASYIELWEKKNELAKEAATEELEPLKAETETKIKELADKALDKYAELRAEFVEQGGLLMSELQTAIIDAEDAAYDEMFSYVEDYTEAGEALMNGIVEGITEKSPELITSVTEAVKRAIAAAKAAAGIHSPSKVTKDEVGANLALGVGEGWKEKLQSLKNSLSSSLSDTIANLRATVAAETSRFAVAGVPDNGFFDLAQAVGTQTAGINSLASFYRNGGNNQKTIILKVGEREFGSAVVDLGEAEQSRRGVKMQTKGVSK